MTPYYEHDGIVLYHADCLEMAAWLLADVMVTDPPYGMSLRSGRNGRFGECSIAGDDSTTTRDAALRRWDGPALVFGRWSVPRPDTTRAVLTWDKYEHVGMGDLSLPWKPNTEEIYVIGTGFVGRRDSSVIRVRALAGTVGTVKERSHPTEKPVALLERLIDKCPPGVIADPFAGSGSTLIAARNLGRRAIGIEIHEPYCEIAAKRLDQLALNFGTAQ